MQAISHVRQDFQETPLISIVIAVHNGGPDLEKCLSGIDALTYPNRECILVDDASTDGMIAGGIQGRNIQLITLNRKHGPAFARNEGARRARGDILFFTDADVVLHPESLSIAARAMQRNASIAAVFGSYDDAPSYPAYLSQYRNLLHHWVHQTGQEEAFSFWSACGAVRKEIFNDLGGFDTGYAVPSIEDIEFGSRLKQRGHAIRLEKTMLCKHLKRWQFVDMVKTDVFRRAIPWMTLLLHHGSVPADLNLDTGSRIATVAAGLLALMFGCLLLYGEISALLPALLLLLLATLVSVSNLPEAGVGGNATVWAGLALILPVLAYGVVSNPLASGPVALLLVLVLARWNFYRFLCRKRNAAFALAALPMQFLHFLGCAIAIPAGLLEFLRAERVKVSSRANPH